MRHKRRRTISPPLPQTRSLSGTPDDNDFLSVFDHHGALTSSSIYQPSRPSQHSARLFQRLLSAVGVRNEDNGNAAEIVNRLTAFQNHSSLADRSLGKNDKANSILPPEAPFRSPWVFYLPEAYPRRFTDKQRADLDKIFRRNDVRVPMAVCDKVGTRLPVIWYVDSSTEKKKKIEHRPQDLPLGAGLRGWPESQLPLEVFELIADYLPRESMQAMRLVNKEFEMKTSNRLFHTVVVPFRSEIYGLMTKPSDGHRRAKSSKSRKGKGKARDVSVEKPNKKERRLHDGMKVFQAWGEKIKRFALAFEVDEATLESAPKKGRFERHETWWGKYQWPHQFYNRFEVIEVLEKKADEFRCMSQALSYLKKVRELGLSLESGLGWLSGPDMSDRARLLHQKPEVFGNTKSIPDAKHAQNLVTWKEMVDSIGPAPSLNSLVPTAGAEHHEVLVSWPEGQKTVSVLNPTGGQDRFPIIFEGKDFATTPSELSAEDHLRFLRDGLSGLSKGNNAHVATSSLKPSELNVPQQEWLLEIEWAQRAFLSSFCMALCDNSSTFQHVHTLNVSRFSSNYLIMLQRTDFWQSLPNVTTLTLKILPDWRTIHKTDTGFVSTEKINPSSAATSFYNLLANHISPLRNIKTLTIGYVGGGEQASGIFARNKSILPAPITPYAGGGDSLLHPADPLLRLPHIQTLSLENMWATPSDLKGFLGIHSSTLKHLTLSSISLTRVLNPNTRAPDFSDPEGLGISPVPQDLPRYNDPSCGNLFSPSQRNLQTPQPDPQGWISAGIKVGEWADVIDTITPGPTLDFLRYAYCYRDVPPSLNTTVLESVHFQSCGYVRLEHFSNVRPGGAVGDLVAGNGNGGRVAALGGNLGGNAAANAGNGADGALPQFLVRRAGDLVGVMMSREKDELLGSINSVCGDEEVEVLTTGFPMTVGRGCWGIEIEDIRRAKECLEDGQPEGGTGRFSGIVRKLELPPPEEGGEVMVE